VRGQQAYLPPFSCRLAVAISSPLCGAGRPSAERERAERKMRMLIVAVAGKQPAGGVC
jgi:hypothetical protein